MNKIIEEKNRTSDLAGEEMQVIRSANLNQTDARSANEGEDTTRHSPHDPPGEKAHTTLILVNGVEHRVKKGAVGYEDIVTLAAVDPSKHYDVTFENGPRGSETGKLVPNGPHTHIGNEEVFTVVEHTIKTLIIVNGTQREVDGDTISFEQVVKLAFGEATGTFTVVYEFGPRGEEHGSMEPGQIVHIKDREVFDVSNTYKS